jgi:serine/threonine-protein kinase
MALEDRYKMQDRMGEGGFSRVFRGEERTTGRPVALKVLKSAFYDNLEVRERFQREVFAVASLSNPHIVGMYDFGLNDTNVYIAMEYVAGQTLREALQGELSISNRFSIVAQIAEAVAAAHARNVVHRDLKPENVKVVAQADGTLDVKVLDFGMAKLTELESRLELQPLTRVGICFGTPQYMSPEQIRGKLDDPSIDLFALAIMAYELISGRRPWDGSDPYEVMRAVLRLPAPLISQVVGASDDAPLAEERLVALNAFFQRALAKSRADRPADAKSLVEDLERALFGAVRSPVVAFSGSDRPRREDDTIPVESMRLARALAGVTEPHVPVLPQHSERLRTASGSIEAIADVTQPALPPTHVEGAVHVEAQDPSSAHVRAEARAEVALAAQAFTATRRGSFRRLLLPLLLLAAVGGSVGYVLACDGSAQAGQLHDFLVGKK